MFWPHFWSLEPISILSSRKDCKLAHLPGWSDKTSFKLSMAIFLWAWLNLDFAPSFMAKYDHWLYFANDYLCLPYSQLMHCLGMLLLSVLTKISGSEKASWQTQQWAVLWPSLPTSVKANQAPGPIRLFIWEPKLGRPVIPYIPWLDYTTILALHISRATGWDYFLGSAGENSVC